MLEATTVGEVIRAAILGFCLKLHWPRMPRRPRKLEAANQLTRETMASIKEAVDQFGAGMRHAWYIPSSS